MESTIGPQTDTTHPVMNTIVIDDDVDVRDLFVELLQLNKINVVAVGSNGKEAIGLYETHKPDLVFLDYLMPEYDGVYAAKKIREIDPHAIIVLISGSYFEEGKLDNLVNAVLKKPIEMGDVIGTINKMTCTMSAK